MYNELFRTELLSVFYTISYVKRVVYKRTLILFHKIQSNFSYALVHWNKVWNVVRRQLTSLRQQSSLCSGQIKCALSVGIQVEKMENLGFRKQ